MKKEAVPAGFPVGRLRLTKQLTQMFRSRGSSPTSKLPPMVTPFGGTAPVRKPGSTFEHDARTIAAREKGTLTQFLAAKEQPLTLHTDNPPNLDTSGVHLTEVERDRNSSMKAAQDLGERRA